MSNPPFSLRIFVADGDPDGLRLVERSNWIGKAVVFPRAIYPSIRNREQFRQTGVYMLLGPRPDGDGEMLYVGEGDPVGPRLESHHANRDFWTQAVFFIAGTGQLNKAHVQYLESRLVARGFAAKRVKMDNAVKPTEPTLSEADRADMDVFLSNILGMLPVLGIHAFEKSMAGAAPSDESLLTCQGRGAVARGRDTAQGFVVVAGSEVAVEEVPSLQKYFPNIAQLRKELRENGVLVQQGALLKFAQDYSFSSPSMASSFVLGSSSNGRNDWKDSEGRTLKEIQAAQITISSGNQT